MSRKNTKKVRHRHTVIMDSKDDCRSFLLKRFGLDLPKEIHIMKTKMQGIRVYSETVDEHDITGLRGFACYSSKRGLNNFLIQQFGHLAKKNVIALNHADAVKYLIEKDIQKKNISIDEGYVILSYKGHILGLGRFKKGIIYSRFKGMRRNEIVDDIKPYPGRNI